METIYRFATSAGSGIGSRISLLLTVLELAGRWKLFEKAGEPGWKSIIPFYVDYTEYKIVGKRRLFWAKVVCYILQAALIVLLFSAFLELFLSLLFGAGSIDSGSSSPAAELVGALWGTGALPASVVWLLVVTLALVVLSLALRIIISLALCDAFGAARVLAIGLILLPPLGFAILGFSDTYRYQSAGRQA